MATPLSASIVAARTRAGLSPAQVSRAAGIDPAGYARIETGEIANPSFGSVVRIARALGCDLQTLAEGSDFEISPEATHAIRDRSELERVRNRLRDALQILDQVLDGD